MEDPHHRDPVSHNYGLAEVWHIRRTHVARFRYAMHWLAKSWRGSGKEKALPMAALLQNSESLPPDPLGQIRGQRRSRPPIAATALCARSRGGPMKTARHRPKTEAKETAAAANGAKPQETARFFRRGSWQAVCAQHLNRLPGAGGILRPIG